jgi:hypothetical protein
MVLFIDNKRKKNPIFLTHSQNEKLRNLAGYDFKSTSSIFGWSRLSDKVREDKIYEAFHKMKFTNGDAFLREYVNRKIVGKEAIDNTINLLNCFAAYSAINIYLEPFEFEKFDLVSEHLDGEQTQTKEISIKLILHKKISEYDKIKNYFLSKKKPISSVDYYFNLNNVESIIGSFGFHMQIITKRQVIDLSWGDYRNKGKSSFSILPHNKSKTPHRVDLEEFYY